MNEEQDHEVKRAEARVMWAGEARLLRRKGTLYARIVLDRDGHTRVEVRGEDLLGAPAWSEYDDSETLQAVFRAAFRDLTSTEI